jgi:hypothetical protein
MSNVFGVRVVVLVMSVVLAVFVSLDMIALYVETTTSAQAVMVIGRTTMGDVKSGGSHDFVFNHTKVIFTIFKNSL